MLPQYQRLDDGNINSQSKKNVYSIKFGKFAVYVVFLPLLSFIFCVFWSILFYFERATSTHCHVFNFLPSISAAIGNYQPQRIVWQSAIALHEIPRYIVTYMYYEYYNKVIRKNRRNIAYLALTINVIEVGALFALSIWTSVDNYGKYVHRYLFYTTISKSVMHLIDQH